MREALADITSQASKLAKPRKGDIIIDVGCNDGTLLRSYRVKGLRLVGFEPAKNLVKWAKEGTNLVVNDFFSHRIFRNHFPSSRAFLIVS